MTKDAAEIEICVSLQRRDVVARGRRRVAGPLPSHRRAVEYPVLACVVSMNYVARSDWSAYWINVEKSGVVISVSNNIRTRRIEKET